MQGEQRTGQNEQHLRTGLADGLERLSEIVWRVFKLERVKFQAQRFRGAPGRLKLVGHERVPENAQTCSSWNSLSQQLDLLGGYFCLLIEQSRNVAAWPGKTGDIAARYWVIVDRLQDNRNRTARIEDCFEHDFRPLGAITSKCACLSSAPATETPRGSSDRRYSMTRL